MIEAAALAEFAGRRSQSYWFLSRLVLDAPTPGFLDELAAALDAAPPAPELPLGSETLALCNAVRGALAEPNALTALAVEQTRLLGGLARSYGAPPPYESVFREDKLPGEATISVSAAYAQAGFDPPVPAAGPADHLGAELRFLALLCHLEHEAWQAGERANAAAWVERERAFLDDHVLQWVPQHCEKVLALAATPYHRAMFALIARACLFDRDDVEELEAHGAATTDGG